jgi:hypothetical protein
MGDGVDTPDGKKGKDYLHVDYLWTENPHSKPTCVKITYNPGSAGWAGFYWLNKENNWGDKTGEDFSKKSFKQVTFFARGEKGGEVVKFKVGGVSTSGKPNKDSFEAEPKEGAVTLTKEWKQYRIDLEGKNLSSVIGMFCWTASELANPKGLSFYLDDIQYE